jgi:multicomponent Na+:H+ antiporter subunit E
MLAVHLLLAALLAIAVGRLTPSGLVVAWLVVYFVLKLFQVRPRIGRHVRWLERGSAFMAWFIVEIFKASIDVARIVFAPQVHCEPAVVEVQLRCRDDNIATLVGCLLTLTPGTLAMDYARDSGTMFVHVLHATSLASVEGAVHEIEARLLDWLRPVGGGQPCGGVQDED